MNKRQRLTDFKHQDIPSRRRGVRQLRQVEFRGSEETSRSPSRDCRTIEIPQSSSAASSGAKEELFGRIFRLRDRMLGAEKSKRVLTGESPSEAVGSPPASQEPSPLPRGARPQRTRLRAPESEG
jgi:hypothetical protein